MLPLRGFSTESQENAPAEDGQEKERVYKQIPTKKTGYKGQVGIASIEDIVYLGNQLMPIFFF